jgi:hypothetical protein
MFQDQLETARKHFDEMQQARGYAGINAAQMFRGAQAYQQIAKSQQVDVVVITCPVTIIRSTWKRSTSPRETLIKCSLSTTDIDKVVPA